LLEGGNRRFDFCHPSTATSAGVEVRAHFSGTASGEFAVRREKYFSVRQVGNFVRHSFIFRPHAANEP
jgi:hypothetical protein